MESVLEHALTILNGGKLNGSEEIVAPVNRRELALVA